MADLLAWKNSKLGQHLAVDGVKGDAGQCSQVPESWAMTEHPGVALGDLLPQLGADAGVKDWAGKSTKYYIWIENNHADVNQLPLPGDIGVSGATPAKGYTNKFKNDDGHTWVFGSASPSGYTAIQQNAPQDGQGVNETGYPWNYRPVLGWFREVAAAAQPTVAVTAAAVAPVNSVHVDRTLHLPASIAEWHVYNVDGPYDLAHATHVIKPKQFGGLSYVIQRDLGNGIYVIHTEDFGDVAIWTQGTVATIS